MKIAWFTPFAKESAIGRYSRLVTDELAKAAEVDLWVPEARHYHPTALRTIKFGRLLEIRPDTLAHYDLVVYQLGDHLPYHRQIFEASRKVPGIVILHDFVMHHFFAGYFLQHKNSREEYMAVMTRHYGDRGKAVTQRAFDGLPPWVWETDAVVDFPFFEEAIRGAYGVIVHSNFLAARIGKTFQWPVRKLDLPYDAGSGSRPVYPRKKLGIREEDILIVTVGHVNSNKRVPSVLEALARNSQNARKITYAVLGPCDAEYHKELVALARQHGIQDEVRLPGFVSEDHLHSYLSHADICVNLRFPAMEGGSASVIEEMLYGKPVVVTDTGFYAELPNDCVRKVRPEHEVEDLTAALCDLISDKPSRKELGNKAQQFAREHFRADKYSQGFLDFTAEILAAKPLFQLADRIGQHLAGMGVGSDARVLERVAQESFHLFCQR